MTRLTGCLVLLGVSACGGPLEGAREPATTGDPEVIERTVVHLLADGQEQVTTSRISAAQHRLEVTEHEQLKQAPNRRTGTDRQGLVALDTSCAGSSMWLFDANYHHVEAGLFSHEICFFRDPGTPYPVCADLRRFRRVCFAGGGCQNWATDTGNWVGSYYSGKDTGYFSELNGAADLGFGKYQYLDNAWQQMSRATNLCFDIPWCPTYPFCQ